MIGYGLNSYGLCLGRNDTKKDNVLWKSLMDPSLQEPTTLPEVNDTLLDSILSFGSNELGDVITLKFLFSSKFITRIV